MFRGRLSTELPPDPNVKYSGYCAIRSQPLEVFFSTEITANPHRCFFLLLLLLLFCFFCSFFLFCFVLFLNATGGLV